MQLTFRKKTREMFLNYDRLVIIFRVNSIWYNCWFEWPNTVQVKVRVDDQTRCFFSQLEVEITVDWVVRKSIDCDSTQVLDEVLATLSCTEQVWVDTWCILDHEFASIFKVISEIFDIVDQRKSSNSTNILSQNLVHDESKSSSHLDFIKSFMLHWVVAWVEVNIQCSDMTNSLKLLQMPQQSFRVSNDLILLHFTQSTNSHYWDDVLDSICCKLDKLRSDFNFNCWVWLLH